MTPENSGEIITFWTLQDRLHDGTSLGQWLFDELGRLGYSGATLTGGLVGRGRDGSVHAITLMDIAEQPLQVSLAVERSEGDRLIETLAKQNLGIFYTRVPARFGTI